MRLYFALFCLGVFGHQTCGDAQSDDWKKQGFYRPRRNFPSQSNGRSFRSIQNTQFQSAGPRLDQISSGSSYQNSGIQGPFPNNYGTQSAFGHHQSPYGAGRNLKTLEASGTFSFGTMYGSQNQHANNQDYSYQNTFGRNSGNSIKGLAPSSQDTFNSRFNQQQNSFAISQNPVGSIARNSYVSSFGDRSTQAQNAFGSRFNQAQFGTVPNVRSFSNHYQSQAKAFSNFETNSAFANKFRAPDYLPPKRFSAPEYLPPEKTRTTFPPIARTTTRKPIATTTVRTTTTIKPTKPTTPRFPGPAPAMATPVPPEPEYDDDEPDVRTTVHPNFAPAQAMKVPPEPEDEGDEIIDDFPSTPSTRATTPSTTTTTSTTPSTTTSTTPSTTTSTTPSTTTTTTTTTTPSTTTSTTPSTTTSTTPSTTTSTTPLTTTSTTTSTTPSTTTSTTPSTTTSTTPSTTTSTTPSTTTSTTPSTTTSTTPSTTTSTTPSTTTSTTPSTTTSTTPSTTTSTTPSTTTSTTPSTTTSTTTSTTSSTTTVNPNRNSEDDPTTPEITASTTPPTYSLPDCDPLDPTTYPSGINYRYPGINPCEPITKTPFRGPQYLPPGPVCVEPKPRVGRSSNSTLKLSDLKGPPRPVWHAGVFRKTSSPYQLICGGSIVRQDIVISAAHCFWDHNEGKEPAERFAVAAHNMYKAWTNIKDTGAQKSDVTDIILPPRFLGVRTHFQDDLAILKLATPFTYNQGLKPICVDFDDDFNGQQLKAGHEGAIAVWRNMDVDPRSPELLSWMEMPYVEIETCIRDAEDDFVQYITSDKVCAGDKTGKALCRGDSGGGLAFWQGEPGHATPYLRGVASTAPRSTSACNALAYASFTHLHAHRTFLREHVPDVENCRFWT